MVVDDKGPYDSCRSQSRRRFPAQKPNAAHRTVARRGISRRRITRAVDRWIRSKPMSSSTSKPPAGAATNHRVTEIGAVKVKDGRGNRPIPDAAEPATRPFPAAITRLTNITQEMVADAPYFRRRRRRISTHFSRVRSSSPTTSNSTTGLLRASSRRIGRTFRMPKLCTCSSMRKLYPGPFGPTAWTSLARTYDIPLHQHHQRHVRRRGCGGTPVAGQRETA